MADGLSCDSEARHVLLGRQGSAVPIGTTSKIESRGGCWCSFSGGRRCAYRRWNAGPLLSCFQDQSAA